MKLNSTIPEQIRTEAELEDFLTTPSPGLIDFIKTLSGPLVILGAGGKMGPTLAVVAQRAAKAAGHPLAVIAVSRFSDPRSGRLLEEQGIKTVRCDLLDTATLRQLPDAENVIHLVGFKFGTQANPSTTWAMNTLVPGRVAERYAKAHIVALSTGNVYPLSAVAQGGSLETDPLTPLGEYANATVGRERIFEFFSRQSDTRVALLRLYYAIDLRYGVLTDIAQKVFTGQPIRLENGYFNCIWQGDANDMIIRALALAASPASVWNLCRPEIFSVREVAGQFGELFGKEPQFSGKESATAFLGNAAKLCAVLGEPSIPLSPMLRWVAHWIKLGGRNLGRPTHFEVRDGGY